MRKLLFIVICSSVLAWTPLAGAASLNQQVKKWEAPVLPILQKVVNTEIKLNKNLKYLDRSSTTNTFQNIGYSFWNEESKLQKYEHTPLRQLTVAVTVLCKSVNALGGDATVPSPTYKLSALQVIDQGVGNVERAMTEVIDLLKQYTATKS